MNTGQITPVVPRRGQLQMPKLLRYLRAAAAVLPQDNPHLLFYVAGGCLALSSAVFFGVIAGQRYWPNDDQQQKVGADSHGRAFRCWSCAARRTWCRSPSVQCTPIVAHPWVPCYIVHSTSVHCCMCCNPEVHAGCSVRRCPMRLYVSRSCWTRLGEP